MAKAVFRPGELLNVPEAVMIETPVRFANFPEYAPTEAEIEAEPEREVYSGPTAEELNREAEEFRLRMTVEGEALIEVAKAEAAEVAKEAAAAAQEERQRAQEEAQACKEKAAEDAQALIEEARLKAEELIAEGRKTLEAEKEDARKQGVEAGREEGFAQGNVEVERLVERMRVVLERAQDKRSDILSDTEREIIELVLLVSRKVVKAISDSQREVIVSNVIQALRKVRDRGNIIIRVNLADLKLATSHVKNFIKLVEGVKSIQVAEDSSVDPGGCIIETDFGEIDARISSQLAELEAKILQISPIKTRIKSGARQ
ncbi:MAG: flagellar assembly protein FliH [Treponema sp.]|nr:flagellar assembly protein FliH [Treponema sp.]